MNPPPVEGAESAERSGGDGAAIDVRGLTKRYGGRAVVDAVDLQVRQGRICGFLGPNGSGKTTTIRMLCGLLRPDAGAGRCLGMDIATQSAEIRREVGYMTQRFGLYDDLSIRENLDFIGRLYELPQRRAAVDRTLERLGLQARARQLAGTLSGGWKQRLALAACLMHEPRLLLLDEPTAGVDPKARREFWDQIHALAAEGMTVLVSTHYMDEAERCHELVYIAYGKVLARGTRRQIIDAAGLTVWAVQGNGDSVEDAQAALAAALKAAPGVLSVAAFGNAMHVAGRDAAALDAAIAPYRGLRGLEWQRTQANLEDVFISLIAQAQDNFAGAA
ncbi:MAG: ABC transporter ATP-binding protein [Burkholderiales bacterium]|nr:ABC transporter ATP-binding protein [Burkholderiales bacterium]